VLVALTGCGSLIGVDDLVFDRPEDMVEYTDERANALFIDPREISNADYAAWLAADPAPAVAPQIATACAWNTSYVPGDTAPNGDAASDCTPGRYDWDTASRDTPHRPVSCIDWCDAATYCLGQGKRLCGGIDGETTSIRYDAATGAFVNDIPKSSAWYLACSAGGADAYPYGDVYDASACNGESGDSADVATRPRCEGGYAGAFDLSGNIEEWEDACVDSSTDSACSRRGGAFYSAQIYDPTWLRCDFQLVASRKAMAISIGARCCWEP
jgi:sulfatase modifying factor 1